MYFIVNGQIQEMNVFQQNLYDLERTQQAVKKQYVHYQSSRFAEYKKISGSK